MALIPKNEHYFDLLTEMVRKVHSGADLLVKLFENIAKKPDYLSQIKNVEHECDKLSANIIDKINASFITPIDREDLYLLANELDDVMDRINDIALMTVLYGVNHVPSASLEMVQVLNKSVLELEPAIEMLRSRKGVREHIAGMKRLEEEGDRLWQQSIQQLFAQEKDPIELVRWKDIYNSIEAGIDRCNDVAKALESVIVKNG